MSAFLIKLPEIVNKNNASQSQFLKILNLDKRTAKKSVYFYVLRWIFVIEPLTTLYDEYIDQPKLSEQKKPVEYIVPPLGTII